jgi:hypothetical protein
MGSQRLFIFGFILLIFTASFAPSSGASEDLNSKKIAVNEDNTSSECVSYQKIPCNWEGWRSSYPEVKCTRWPCDRYIEVLRMKCRDGFLSEVKAVSICIACQDAPGL